ncbi:MAG: hypothetical protein U9R57_13400 [Thermodesulfobacteriota bacterium]|nr:hypothetical protein [Thermodesulfobacteriota bacterium]
MDAITENSIRQEQVESFGRLMAGLAHDMKNHLGIIRESNGLMGDIIAMGAFDEDEQMVVRLNKSIAAIERRIVISANMMHHLSGLAHRPDTPYSSFLINDLIEEEYTFLERFSRLKQIDIEFELNESLPAVYNDPALFQHIFYRLYALCLEQLDSGQRLIITTEPVTEGVAIVFRLIGNAQVNIEQFTDTALPAAVKKLEGTLETGESSQEHSDILLILSSLSDQA